jgi:hypothetical protein
VRVRQLTSEVSREEQRSMVMSSPCGLSLIDITPHPVKCDILLRLRFVPKVQYATSYQDLLRQKSCSVQLSWPFAIGSERFLEDSENSERSLCQIRKGTPTKEYNMEGVVSLRQFFLRVSSNLLQLIRWTFSRHLHTPYRNHLACLRSMSSSPTCSATQIPSLRLLEIRSFS